MISRRLVLIVGLGVSLGLGGWTYAFVLPSLRDGPDNQGPPPGTDDISHGCEGPHWRPEFTVSKVEGRTNGSGGPEPVWLVTVVGPRAMRFPLELVELWISTITYTPQNDPEYRDIEVFHHSLNYAFRLNDATPLLIVPYGNLGQTSREVEGGGRSALSGPLNLSDSYTFHGVNLTYADLNQTGFMSWKDVIVVYGNPLAAPTPLFTTGTLHISGDRPTPTSCGIGTEVNFD